MKSILVHLDASPRAAARLEWAQQLASRHGAELTALYGALSSVLAMPWAGAGTAGAAALLADLDHQQREQARAMFDRVAGRAGVTWLDAGAAPYPVLLQHAPYADLLVLGQADPDDPLVGPLAPDLVPAVIADTGRPSAVLPFVGDFGADPRRVLIAWKPSRESARAVRAALPWLRLATTVDLATSPETDDPAADPLAALAAWLRLQGVTAALRNHRLSGTEVGEGLLSLAADTSADLLVMGCYGHSRAREWVLGGATRSVLKSMTLPVLMVH